MLSSACLAVPGPISLSQAPILSISTISCQMRQARRSAPAPAMRLTGVNLSLTPQFALPLTIGFQSDQPQHTACIQEGEIHLE